MPRLIKAATGVRWITDAEWREVDHPRDMDGKFASGGSPASSFVNQERKFDQKEFEQLCGKRFTGVKGAAAVEKLLKEQQGHVKAAFYRRDLGNIDLIWGNDNVGLRHILKRRGEGLKIDAKEFVRDLTDIVENGEIHHQKDRDNFEIWKNGKMCIVSNTFYGNRLHLVITEFPSRKKPARFNEQAL